MQVRAGLDLAEEFEQRPRAKVMETAGQVGEALARKRALRRTEARGKMVIEPVGKPLV
jgi:hypothetical protein